MVEGRKVPLTKAGLRQLQKELQLLIEKQRPEVVERLAASRKVGDMDEDNEETQAKQKLSYIDGRISELQDVVDRAFIIDEGHGYCKEIKLGCKITVQTNGKKLVFHLVGEWEADPANAKISHQSPLGQSLLGKRIGDKVKVKAPVGKITYTITKID